MIVAFECGNGAKFNSHDFSMTITFHLVYLWSNYQKGPRHVIGIMSEAGYHSSFNSVSVIAKTLRLRRNIKRDFF